MQDARASAAATRPGPRHYGTLERAGRGSWWALGITLLVILGFMGLARFGTFIIPSLIGIVLATTLSPLVAWARRWHVPRLLAAAVISVFIVAGLVLLAWGIVSLVVNRSPHIWGMLKGGADEIDRWLGRYGAARGTINGLRTQISSIQRGAASGVLPLALRGMRALYSTVVAIFLAAGFSFFFLWEGPDVRRWVSRHLTLPEDVGDAFEAYACECGLTSKSELLKLLIAREMRLNRLSVARRSRQSPTSGRTKVTAHLTNELDGELARRAAALGVSTSHAAALLVEGELTERWLERSLTWEPQL